MSYTTQQHLETRFGTKTLRDLTDRGTPPAGAIDAAVVAQAIADADAVIDGYLAGRYALPLTSLPPLLADLAAAIAFYKLHRQTPVEKVVRDYDQALSLLRDIARGQVMLPVAGTAPAQTTSGVSVITNNPHRPLKGGPMDGYI